MLVKAAKYLFSRISMLSAVSKVLLLISTLAIALPALSQVGHPAKGSWSGWLGDDPDSRERIRLLLDDEDGNLEATINPGRRAVDAEKVTLNASEWNLVIEADLPDGKLVLDGTLSNLGSWSNRKYIGTYTLGGDTGNFNITLN